MIKSKRRHLGFNIVYTIGYYILVMSVLLEKWSGVWSKTTIFNIILFGFIFIGTWGSFLKVLPNPCDSCTGRKN